MAENVSTANYDIRRFDQTASVPTAQIDPNSGMEHAKHLQSFADAIGMFADKGGNAYKAKINRDRRDEAEARRKEIEARQEKNRKENEARIEAERIYTETGGGKSWQELSEEEQVEKVTDYVGPDKSKAGLHGATPTKERTVKKGKYLDTLQKSDNYLKDAYQQKRTEGVLKKQQADWDVVAPDLVDKVYDSWRDQKNRDDGETDFTKYASAKLEIYKLERAQEHFLGLPQLGEALKNVPLNDNKFLSMVALRKQDYIDEIKDKDIQSGIDTALRSGNPDTNLSTPEKIDGLIDHISVATLPGTNKKARLPNGKVVRVHDRDTVQFQLIDDVDNDVSTATSSDAPVFKVIEAFTGKNAEAGKKIFERRNGIGDAWKKTVAAAMKKKVSLEVAEKKANTASNKIILNKAKEASHEAIIRASAALDFTTVGGKLHQQGETQRMQIDDKGKVVGQLDKLQTLQIALANLDGQVDNFAYASMSKESTEMRSKLVSAINELDPTHAEFDVPNNPIATKLKGEFIAQISKLDAKGLEDIRTLVHQNQQQLPWMVKMKHAAIKTRYDELDAARERKKDQLNISKSEQQLKEDGEKEVSSGLARKYRGEIRNEEGNILSSKELKAKLVEIENNKSVIDADAGALTTKYNTLIAEQEKKEHIVIDTKAQTGFFKKITSRGLKGALKTQSEWETLEKEVTDHKWIEGSPQRTQLLALISAGKNKTGDFDTKKAAFIKENEYRTRLAKKAKPIEKNLADIIGRVSLSEKHPDKLTVEDALGKLKEEQDSFAENFEEIIKEGGTLGIDIDHDERFQDTYAEILGQRTEKDRANLKKTLVQDAKLVEIKREKFKADKLDIIRKVTESPLYDIEKDEILTPAEAIERIKTVFANSLHEERNDLGSTFQSSVFTAKEQDDALRKLQVSIKTKSDPSKRVSKAGIITQSYNLQQEAAKLSGSARVKRLEENIVLIEENYLNGNLSTGDFNKERGLIKELQRFGKVKTKPAYQAGENHIRSMFAGHLTKFTNNKMFLPVNEDGKLYDALAQGFNQEFAGISESLQNAPVEEQLAKAYEIAQKYTTYDPTDNHPLGPTVNERIRRYSMDTLALMKLTNKEKKAAHEAKFNLNASKKKTPKTKTTKKPVKSESVQELEDSSETLDALENDPKSYIIKPDGQISILRARDENPQGWLGITWDAVTGIGDDTDETYLTISTPEYLTGS